MPHTPERILLSPPKATESDIEAVTAAMRSGWLAPAGPELNGFEADAAEYLGVNHAIGLSSGTAAIHLALKSLGVMPGDVVITPTVTFAATVFPVTYLGAEPVFVDVDESWNLDPSLLKDAVRDLRASGRRVSAVIPVDLYGTPANYEVLSRLAAELEIPMVEDAAEGLGARTEAGKVGTFGSFGILSFNGNKIITTSGGGMLLTDDGDAAEQARYWATQARDALPWYQHQDVGYNYRLSNLLAALGRSQLRRIDCEVAKRREVREWYRSSLAEVDGVSVQDDPSWGMSNAWLTVVRFDSNTHPNASEFVREALEVHNIESRPTWKPMHQQPVFAGSMAYLSGAADSLYDEGLCLPSGTSLEAADVSRVCSVIVAALRDHQ